VKECGQEKMDKNTFELFGKYNKEVNKKMNEVIKTLSTEEWDKPFSGYYKSIHELCSHVFIADYRMFKAFKSVCTIDYSYFIKEITYKEVLFENVTEYSIKRMELDTIIFEFVKGIAVDDLNNTMELTNASGITISKKLKIFLMTIFNHGTHHRGMISLYLEMLGKENDYSRFIDYV
jgi:uncharacterized damage-inducible protein DinB